MTAPIAGPSTKPAEPAPSIAAFTRSSSSAPSTRNGANDAPAVNVGVPTSPSSHARPTNDGPRLREHERDNHGNREQLRVDQHAARTDPIDEHARDDRPDDRRDGAPRHDERERLRTRLERVRGNAPYPDEEHGGAADPRDETGGDNQQCVAVFDQGGPPW